MCLLKKEFPRYEYQKIRWIKAGKTNTALAMQVDAIWQGMANASFLAIPAFIIAANPSGSISVFEVVGILVWLGSFAMESIADMQKLTFLKAMKKSIVGSFCQQRLPKTYRAHLPEALIQR